jgi:hypothetical protein
MGEEPRQEWVTVSESAMLIFEANEGIPMAERIKGGHSIDSYIDSTARVLQLLLLYGLLPLWMLAGAADWWVHRRERIEMTAGAKESAMHLLMMVELTPAIVAALLLEPTALTLLLMTLYCIAHELTVWWDLRYAASVRRIPVLEQWLHSLQLVLPWVGLAGLMLIHRDQAAALVGQDPPAADWGPRWKEDQLPGLQIATIIGAGLLLVVVPFSEEMLRCMKAKRSRNSAAAAGTLVAGP